jgi:hypothetical protein
MNLAKDFFDSGFELYKFLTQKSQVKNVTKRFLIREIRNNLKRLEHRNKQGANKYSIIQKLENESIVRALSEGYNFNKLVSRREVTVDLAEKLKNAKRYIGWDAERIVNSIDEKIVSLKEIVEIYEAENIEQINITSRLNNLFTLLLLLTLLMHKEK